MPLRKFRGDENDTAIHSKTGPATIDNPFFNPDEENTIDRGQVDDIDNPDASFTRRVLSGDGSEENNEQARELLASGSFTSEAHKRRLERIISVGEKSVRRKNLAAAMGDAEQRKRLQGLADFEFKKLVTAGADPNNPMTVQEFNGAAQGLHQKYLGALLPNPYQVRRAEEEKDNPVVAVANASESISQQMTGSIEQAEFIRPYLDIDPKTRAVSGESYDRAVRAMIALNKGDPKEAQASRTALSQTDRDLTSMRKNNTILFDGNGQLKPRPEIGSYFSSDATDKANQDTYDAEFAKLETLEAQKLKFTNDINRFAGFEAVPKPQTTGGLTEDLANLAEPDKVEIGFSDAAPIKITDSAKMADVFKRAKTAATKFNKTVFIQHPVTGKVIRIKP